MQQTSVGLHQAIEAHFAEVERVGIRNGRNAIVVTNIYIDNVKAFCLKSSKSKIGECKILDKRIKAVLNNHPKGYIFLNSKYSYVFGYSCSIIINTLHELCASAILDYNENRVRFKNIINKWSWLLFTTEIVVSTIITLSYLALIEEFCRERHLNKWEAIFGLISLSVVLAIIISLIHKAITIRHSKLTSIISFAVALIAETVTFFIAIFD